jgi:hypothetical protein
MLIACGAYGCWFFGLQCRTSRHWKLLAVPAAHCWLLLRCALGRYCCCAATLLLARPRRPRRAGLPARWPACWSTAWPLLDRCRCYFASWPRCWPPPLFAVLKSTPLSVRGRERCLHLPPVASEAEELVGSGDHGRRWSVAVGAWPTYPAGR